MPLSFVSIDHVQLAIPPGGEEEARAFYVGVLGMEEVPKPVPMQASGGAWFRSGGVELHLGVQDGFRPAARAHPGIAIADLDQLAAHCSSAGLTPLWDDRYPGVRRFYLHDPFGNRLEFLEKLSER